MLFRPRFRRALSAALVAVPLAAFLGGGLTAPAAGKSAGAGRYWIVLGSDRDGQGSRPYSVRSDGSRLTPLLSHGRGIEAVALSGDGSTVAYTAHRGGSTPIYVSQADGTGFRRLAVGAGVYYAHPALSPDGGLLAYEDRGQIAIVGTDGQGNRRLTSGSSPDWSPDGSALVFADAQAIVVQPLSGSRHEVVHRGAMGGRPVWSPDGRWIAYVSYEGSRRKKNGLYVVQTNGRHRRLVGPAATMFAWSPDARRLAFADAGNSETPRVGIVGVRGRHLRRLSLRVSPGLPGGAAGVAWSPDGHGLILSAHAGNDPDQIWIVGLDGHGLRRVTSSGMNGLVGWTRLPPVLGPALRLPASERVSGPHTVMTRMPITDLSADGHRLAFVPGATATDCDHISVWTPGRKTIVRVSPGLPAPCRGRGEGWMYGVELAGSRVAWAEVLGCGNSCEVTLESATLAARRPGDVSRGGSFNADEGRPFDYRLHGDGELLVFNDGSRLVRIGGGREHCAEGDPSTARICSTLRRGAHAGPIDSASQGLIAVREPDEVAVVDELGILVRTFPFTPNDVSAARLDRGHLVVARLAFLEDYDVATGVRELSRPLPAGYTLADFDESTGIALLRRPKTIMLLRLADGATWMVRLSHGPVLAALEQPGLFYSYAVGKRGRLVFVPRSNLLRRLHQESSVPWLCQNCYVPVSGAF
jgi:Tol biopolymer transport system component